MGYFISLQSGNVENSFDSFEKIWFFMDKKLIFGAKIPVTLIENNAG